MATLDSLDRRLNAHRADLADVRLDGKVEAVRFVAGKPATICSAIADLRGSPDPASPIDHQLLLGHPIKVFEQRDGWAWAQSDIDGYVGYTQAENIGPPAGEPTHTVAARSTFAYPAPEMKLPPRNHLSMGSLLQIESEAETRGTRFAVTADGVALVASHLRPIAQTEPDYVAVAESLIGQPYLWGGASALGLDCSALVQLAMAMTGRTILRDSDMQATTVGVPVEPGDDLQNLRRGDLIFWAGHVGICQGDVGAAPHMVHASGRAMAVVSEPLDQAIARIAKTHGRPTGFRRP